MLTIKYPEIKVKIVGTDGNAFAILGKCCAAMRRANCTKEQIKEFTDEATNGDYDNLLQVCMKYFDIR